MGADELLRTSAPQRIGRYQIRERIGRGAMGVVYHAWDEAMRRDVAVKVLTADLEDEPEIRTRFRREAQATARLLHPNIITILDVGEDGDRLFIVMELLRGSVLKDFLRQPESASLERKIHLMRQLCAGLGAAHRAAVYHRDIKPGNIFVRSDGLLKILDFGVARLATSGITTSGFVVGTPDYMSPEQARGEQIDDRSDIFSMGGVFYFMLTGRKPFASTALPTLFHQIQSEEPTPIEGNVPRELVAIVNKALSKDALRRFQSCHEVAAALERVARLYPIDPADMALHASVEPVRAEGATPPPTRTQGRRDAPVSETRPDTTDDTVDFKPRARANTEDTVPFARLPWTARLRAGIGAIVAVAPRFGAQSTRPHSRSPKR